MHRTYQQVDASLEPISPPQMVEVEIGADIPLLVPVAEKFDLNEWSREFAKAHWV